MTEHYVTLFDSAFLPQGLALHHSLCQQGGDCLLWVLCLDPTCLKTLQTLDPPKMRLLDLASLETPELVAVKSGRTKAEYCWTLTPWSIQWVFEADCTAHRVTYLDADVFFLNSPDPIFSEFEASGRAVLITEHGYAPEYDQSRTSGRYCVQFLPVVRGPGESVLHWWRDRCLEWCFARTEHGLFGDQKYLEKFEANFPGLIVTAEADGRFQGPWNSRISTVSEAMLFHFHGLRISGIGTAFLGHYFLPDSYLKFLYTPYCALLFSLIAKYGLPIIPQADLPTQTHLRLTRLKKRLQSGQALDDAPPSYWYADLGDGLGALAW